MNILIELGCGVPGAVVCVLACGAICAAMVIAICYFIGLYGMSTDCWGICCMI